MAVGVNMTQAACCSLHAPAVWCLTLALPCPIRLLLSVAVSVLDLCGAEILREEGGPGVQLCETQAWKHEFGLPRPCAASFPWRRW